ncbi:hypothetical protein Tco_0543730 [Tanacetum coccineum]
MSSDPNYHWEDLLDIDDFDLPLTPVLRPCNKHVRIVQAEKVEEKQDRIILGPTGIVQLAKIHKQSDIHEGGDDSVLSIQEYMKQVVEDEDFKRDIKTFLKNRKLEQVDAIIKSCSLNALGNLKVTIKDLSSTLLEFSPNPSMHYLNITKKNVVKVFHKDFVPGNGNGVGGSGMLMEEKKIVKLVEKEEMADLELHVCGNVIDQEDLYKFDEEALDLVLEKEARESRAHEECGSSRSLQASGIWCEAFGAIRSKHATVHLPHDLMEVEASGEALGSCESAGAVGSSSSSSSLEI